ncbi:MAG: XdhC/CoxI family protein [Candidatus Omnitrophota bacterium]
MDEFLLQKILVAAKKGQSFAFATIVESTLKGTPRKTGAKMAVLEDGSLYGTIGGGRNEQNAKFECLDSIKTKKSKLVTYNYFGQEGQSICGGRIKVFIEPFIGKKHLIICGAGHIALPLSAMAKMLNFKVTIIDDRKEFAQKSRFPHVDSIVLGSHSKKLAEIPITSETYIMIVTQGNEYDFECLKIAIKTKASYIGVISSKVKRIKFFKRLRQGGVSEKTLSQIHAPAGLDIGAQTPEEIAISIISEIIAKQSGAIKGALKFNQK